MTMFHPIPALAAGDEWTLEQFQQRVVDNLTYLHGLITGGHGSNSFNTNDIIIGGAQGALDGLTLEHGSLVVGTAAGPTGIPRGTIEGQILTETASLPEWQTLTIDIDRYNALKYA